MAGRGHLRVHGNGQAVRLGARALLAKVDHALRLVVCAEAPAALQREVERRRLYRTKPRTQGSITPLPLDMSKPAPDTAPMRTLLQLVGVIRRHHATLTLTCLSHLLITQAQMAYCTISLPSDMCHVMQN
jgi:hypothetical protein